MYYNLHGHLTCAQEQVCSLSSASFLKFAALELLREESCAGTLASDLAPWALSTPITSIKTVPPAFAAVLSLPPLPALYPPLKMSRDRLGNRLCFLSHTSTPVLHSPETTSLSFYFQAMHHKIEAQRACNENKNPLTIKIQ